MMRSWRRGAAILLGVTMLAAGCGGEGSPAEGDPAASYDPEASTTMTVARPLMTKAQFVARMSETCRKAWITVKDNWAEYTSTQDGKKGEVERFDEAVRTSLLSGIDFHIFDNFRILGAPPGEEEAIEAIIGPFQIAVELGWQARWHARTTADVVAQFQTYNERARAYGLDECLVDEAHLRLKPIAS
jgi:hypothetical protein